MFSRGGLTCGFGTDECRMGNLRKASLHAVSIGLLQEVLQPGVQKGAEARAAEYEHLTALNSRSEAEGTRTLNLRIDSPELGS